MDFSNVDVALFDLDGVLTPTAEVHQKAWKRTFDEFLQARSDGDIDPFTNDDYLTYVDGKPRYEGVRSFLESRGIPLPDGDHTDPPGYGTVAALGNAKNQKFNGVLESEGVEAYPDAIELLDHLRHLDVRLVVVSSSANAVPVLGAAGISDRFEFVMDGVVARRRDLPGKPRPDTFIAAAAEVGATVAGAVVFEDAVSGVQAGRAGAFHTVVGVDRTGSADALKEAGADIVVERLTELID